MSYDHNNFNLRLDAYVATEAIALFGDREKMDEGAARALYEKHFRQRPPDEVDILQCMVVTAIRDEMLVLTAKFRKSAGERGSDQEVFDFGEEALAELVDTFREQLGMPSEHRKKSH